MVVTDPVDPTTLNGTGGKHKGPRPPKGGGLRVVSPGEPSWRDRLITKENPETGRETVLTVMANVHVYLSLHPAWEGVVAWDTFGERIVKRAAPPWGGSPGPWEDSDTGRVMLWLSREEGFHARKTMIEEALPLVAEASSFHPVRDYLHSLKWDAKQRLPKWLATYCGVADTEYASEVGRRWMISAVARAMLPGCQADCTLILEGAQGTRKSSAFRALVPDPSFFSETGITIGDKDSYQMLHGVWIYLLDELESLRRSEITRTKNFLTSTRDHYRPPYARTSRDFLRQNVFAGTTNEDAYFSDRTGNRRFWPVRVTREIDVDAIARDRDQLWAEAMARYLSSERWYVDTPHLRDLCAEQQCERVQSDAWEPIVAAWLARPTSDDGDGTRTLIDTRQGILTADILVHALHKRRGDITRADEMRVAEVLRSLGYIPGPQRREQGARVRRYLPPPG